MKILLNVSALNSRNFLSRKTLARDTDDARTVCLTISSSDSVISIADSEEGMYCYDLIVNIMKVDVSVLLIFL